MPGALVSALAEFGVRGIDLTRIESRPTRIELGTYLFFAGLRRPHRRRRGRRGTQSAAPSLCRRAIPGFVADGLTRRALRHRADEAARWLTRLRDGKPDERGSRRERSVDAGAARPVLRQRRAPPRHPPAWRGTDAVGPRAGPRVRPRCRAAGGMLAHSVATRASQTAAVIGSQLEAATHRDAGIHEVQVGSWKTATTTTRSPSSTRSTSAGTTASSTSRYPVAKPATTCWTATCRCSPTCACAISTTTIVHGDIVLVSHGAAIRLAAAVLAGVEADFALDNHLDNTESVALTPITDGRWSCVRWGSADAAVLPEEEATPVADAVRSSTDPMG